VISESFGNHACLLKYFPKYYKNLNININQNKNRIRSKVKQVKVIRTFFCEGMQRIQKQNQEGILKELLRTSRKTLRSLPRYKYDWGHYDIESFHLSMFFPRIITLNVSKRYYPRDYAALKYLSRDEEREFDRSYGCFWTTNRFVRKLKIANDNPYYWMIMRKVSSNKRFLLSLETLELKFWVHQGNEKESLVELLRHKEFLECVTHLNFAYSAYFPNFPKIFCYHELVQALISACSKIVFLLLPLEIQNLKDFEKAPKDFFSSGFSQLQSLQTLELYMNNLEILTKMGDLPPSVRKISFNISDINTYPSDFQDILNSQYFNENDKHVKAHTYEEEWQSFQKHMILVNFFAKWHKLPNLKVLELKIPTTANMDNLLKNFLLPLLKATPHLETFSCQFSQSYRAGALYEKDTVLDLDVLLQGVKSLKFLKNFKLYGNEDRRPKVMIEYNPQNFYSIPQISTVEIDLPQSIFHLNKFYYTFLKDSNESDQIKNIKVSRLEVTSGQSFILLLKLLNKASQIKALQSDLEVNLLIKDLGEIILNFRYPIYLAENIRLTLNIYMVNPNAPLLTDKLKEDLMRIFGRVEFTLKHIPQTPEYLSENFLDPAHIYSKMLLTNKRETI